VILGASELLAIAPKYYLGRLWIIDNHNHRMNPKLSFWEAAFYKISLQNQDLGASNRGP